MFDVCGILTASVVFTRMVAASVVAAVMLFTLMMMAALDIWLENQGTGQIIFYGLVRIPGYAAVDKDSVLCERAFCIL